MDEKLAIFPLWLEYSGLPAHLNKKPRGGAVWLVFKKIVELDCEQNVNPDVVEITISELGERTGLEFTIIERAIKKLKKEKILGCFLPDSPEETALLKINVPLKCPVSAEHIKKNFASVFPPGKDYFRYFDKIPDNADEHKDPALRQIIDLYFNSLGLKMNTFILDQLRIIRSRFELERIRKTFARAKRHNIRSLHWVVRELLREQKRNAKEKEK